jgi:hypothetical protein
MEAVVRFVKLTGGMCALALGLLLVTAQRPVMVSAQSTAYGLNIPAGHPRLWWTPDRVTRARAWLQSNPFTPRPDDPMGLATRCVLTGEANYCQSAVNYAMNQMCSNAACNSTDPNYGVAADDARWEGENVITVFDWCYQYFTPAQRATLIDRWNTYFRNIRLRSWGGPAMVQSNYNWGYMRNEIEWGIATWGENPEADANLRYAMENRWGASIAPHFRTGGLGGVLQEGSAYGSAIGEYSTVPYGSAALMGRDLYRETNFFREAVLYMVHATLPGLTYNKNDRGSYRELFPFADDERFFDGGMAARANYGTFMLAMADFWRDVPIGQYARQWVNTVNPVRPVHVRAIDRGGAALDFANLPLDYYAPGPRFFFGRNQWSAQSTVFNLQLGVTEDEGHRHNDVGSWQLWRNGRWLSRETTGYSQDIAGYNGTPVDANNAVAHNTLFIGGRGPASDYQRGPTVVTRLESRPTFAFAAVDLTPSYHSSYPQLDNPGATQVVREFLFVRPLEALIVFDRVEGLASTTPKTFIAHFETNPTVDSGGKTVTAVNGDQELRITTLVPANPTYRPIVNEGGAVGQYRLEVETSGAVQSYFLNVLEAKATADADLAASVVDNGSTFTLTLNHPARGSATVVFQKGRVSAGGSVVIADQASPLTATVSPISVTDNGVSWEATPVPGLPSAPTGLRIVRPPGQ